MTYVPLATMDQIKRSHSHLITPQGQAAALQQQHKEVELAEGIMTILKEAGAPVKPRTLFDTLGDEQSSRSAMWRLIDLSYIRITRDRSVEVVPENERTANVGWY